MAVGGEGDLELHALIVQVVLLEGGDQPHQNAAVREDRDAVELVAVFLAGTQHGPHLRPRDQVAALGDRHAAAVMDVAPARLPRPDAGTEGVRAQVGSPHASAGVVQQVEVAVVPLRHHRIALVRPPAKAVGGEGELLSRSAGRILAALVQHLVAPRRVGVGAVDHHRERAAVVVRPAVEDVGVPMLAVGRPSPGGACATAGRPRFRRRASGREE